MILPHFQEDHNDWVRDLGGALSSFQSLTRLSLVCGTPKALPSLSSIAHCLVQLEVCCSITEIAYHHIAQCSQLTSLVLSTDCDKPRFPDYDTRYYPIDNDHHFPGLPRLPYITFHAFTRPYWVPFIPTVPPHHPFRVTSSFPSTTSSTSSNGSSDDSEVKGEQLKNGSGRLYISDARTLEAWIGSFTDKGGCVPPGLSFILVSSNVTQMARQQSLGRICVPHFPGEPFIGIVDLAD
jgi:hypothetical protein